jgi:hypothetical protein
MNFPRRSWRIPAISALRLGLLLIGFHAAGCLATAVRADTDPSLITAPETLQVDAGSEQPLPVSVVTRDDVPKHSMLLISGLPPTSVLSAGRLFASGTWALRLTDLSGLKIETTPNATGEIKLSLSIVTLDGRALSERNMNLSIVQPNTGAISPGAEQKSILPTAATPAPTGQEDARALMARGDANLAAGKVPVARLFYRRASDQGWAAGAMAMAQTYDPHELARLGIVGGVQPDAEQARAWYEKARSLGATDADGKLRRLSQR